MPIHEWLARHTSAEITELLVLHRIKQEEAEERARQQDRKRPTRRGP